MGVFKIIPDAKRDAILNDLRHTADAKKIIANRHGVTLHTVRNLCYLWELTGRHVTPAPPRSVVRKDHVAMPADFRVMAAKMTSVGLAKHYGTQRQKISRWRRETGVYFTYDRSAVQKAAAARRKAAENPPPPVRAPSTPKRAIETTPRRMDAAWQARDYLSRVNRVEIVRCNEHKRPTPSGAYWRYGDTLKTDEQLIERAEEVREREARRAVQYRTGASA